MENIEQKVRQRIDEIFSQKCGGMKRTQLMAQLEGLSIIRTITSMISEIEREKQDQIEQLQDENRQLRGRLNMLSFGKNPQRDKQLLELHARGLLPGGNSSASENDPARCS